MKKMSTLHTTLASIAVSLIAAFAAPASHAAPVTLSNTGFESPSQGSGGGAYTYYSGLQGGWTFSGGSGLAANNSNFNVSNADGNQAAFLQNVSGISQAFNFGGGNLQLSFLAESRAGYSGGNSITVFVDDQAVTFTGLSSFLSPTSNVFTSYTSDLLSIGAGQHTLSFVGSKLSGDQTTFIDNVSLNAVPEPASLVLFGIGALAVAGLRRRRQS